VDRFTLLANLLRRLDYWAARLADPALIDTWQARLITLGQQISAHAIHQDNAEKVIAGLAFGVDPDGSLLIRDNQGIVHRLIAGEVTLRNSQ
jgi:biotin-(acetyl-CoA carboxylase) ligase